MIVPMKKISLFLIGDRKEESLRALRKLGIVHLEAVEKTGEKADAVRENIARLEKALYLLEEIKKEPDSKSLSVSDALELAEKVEGLTGEKETCREEILARSTELARLSTWGEIDPNEFSHLEEKGISLLLAELPSAEFDALGEEVQALVLRKSRHSVKCLLISPSPEAASRLASYTLPLPKVSTKTLKEEIFFREKRMKAIEEELQSLAAFSAGMKKALALLEKDLEFHTHAEAAAEELLSQTGKKVSVSYFIGYVEAEKLPLIQEKAKENSWGLLVEEPTEEDNVPTKLKNNSFVSLIYPLTDFLGTVPGYFEYDISSWFLFFLLIFFGIIFGDGGYGLLVLAIAAIPILKAVLAKKTPSPTFLLVGLFGLSTLLWGMLTCTWFGLSPDLLPGWLKALSVPFLSNVYADRLWQPFWTSGSVGLTTSQNLQIFCFTLALIQLSVAHIKVAMRNRRSLKILGDIGSIFQLLGIYYVVLSLVVNPQVFPLGLVIAGIPIGGVAVALVGLGFVMTFLFSNFEGSLGKSVVASLKNIVSMLLGVVNVFSDIVSYIRLWAVGLAGAAISATVNELASPLLGNFLFMILAIVLLVFGHGLNLILNVLSVIVHGIRLNTLEFSSHLDMSWSGHKFKPFEE